MTMIECDLCNEKVEESTIEETTDGSKICEDCVDSDDVIECYECHDLVLRDSSYVNESYDSDCHFCSRDCFQENHSACDNCGEYFHNDDLSDDRCSDCEDSSDDYCDGRFDYHEPTFKYFQTEEKNKLDTKGFTIGIELETCNEGDISDFDSAKHLTIDEKTLLKTRVCAKEDGSLPDNGVEFTTLPSDNDEAYATATTLTKFLAKNEFGITNQCGFHLHIGEKKSATKRLNPTARHKVMITYAIFHRTIFDFLTPARKGNSYCDSPNFKLMGEMFAKKSQASPEAFYSTYISDRYNMINLYSWATHNTLELRNHEGTIDEETVMNWIKVNIAIFDFAIGSSYSDLLKLTGSWSEMKKKVIKDNKLATFYATKRKNWLKKHSVKVGRKKYRRVETIIVNDIKRKEKGRRPATNGYGRDTESIYINFTSKAKDKVIPELAELLVS